MGPRTHGEVVSFTEFILKHVQVERTHVSEDEILQALVKQAQRPFEVLRDAGVVDGFSPRDCLLEVVKVASGSPAQIAGVSVGDYLLAVNGKTPGAALKDMVDEAGSEVVYLRDRNLDEAIIVRLKHPSLRTGSVELCGYKMTLLWFANTLNNRTNLWGYEEDDLAVMFLFHGKAEQALEVVQGESGLPLREMPQEGDEDEDSVRAMYTTDDSKDNAGDDAGGGGFCGCCVVREPPQPSVFSQARQSPMLVVHASALVDLGDLRYAERIVQEFDRRFRTRFTANWGLLSDAVKLQISAARSKRLTEEELGFMLDNADGQPLSLTDRIFEELISLHAPAHVPAFRRRKVREHPLVGAVIPDLAALPAFATHFAPINGRGQVVLAEQQLRLRSNQLVAVVYMGRYRANGPYEDLINTFSSHVGLLVPDLVVGALALTWSTVDPETDPDTKRFMAAERRARNANVPWAVLLSHEDRLRLWERELFKEAKGGPERFTGIPAFLLVDGDGMVRSVGDWDMLETLAKLHELPPTSYKPFMPRPRGLARAGADSAPRPADMLRSASAKF